MNLEDVGRYYVLLGLLVRDMPDLMSAPKPEQHRWVARARALIEICGTADEKTAFNSAADSLDTSSYPTSYATKIGQIVHIVLARFELLAPATIQGAFIPVGSVFDAKVAIGKILGLATTDALIIDPYMDEKALTEFATSTADNVPIRLLADAAHVKTSLKPTVTRWQTQYGTTRPLEASTSSQPPRSNDHRRQQCRLHIDAVAQRVWGALSGFYRPRRG